MSERLSLMVDVGPSCYYVIEWSGHLFSEPTRVAFDCETEMIREDDPEYIPKLALLTTYDDCGASLLIHPDQIADWVLAMRGKQLIGHNVAFDFLVIANHLGSWAKRWDALEVWWEIASRGRIHDTMILERLIALAHSDEHPGDMQRLDKLAKKYLDIELDKDSPFRTRFGELVGRSPAQLWEYSDIGFFKYAIADSICTLKIYDKLRKEAAKYRPRLTEILPGAEEKWGQLTETLQVRGAIALAEISRTGIRVDLDQVEPVRVEIQRIVNEKAEELEVLGAEFTTDAVFKYNKHGMFIRTDGGVPRKNAKVIKRILDEIAKRENIFPPENKDDLVTDSVKYWGQHSDVHPFVQTYVTWAAQAKLAQFLVNLKDERIYPRYTPLVRTGRASCSKPNLQQLPRQSDFREMIVPAKDHWLLSIDYGTLELRTLAQTCLTRFGKSALADVFIAGGDPHIFTAAMVLDTEVGEFLLMPKEVQKQHRQRAKAINFGVPGGLGSRALQVYAKAGYGVDMTMEEAFKLRNKLITEIYPELKRHLQEQKYHIVAENMCVDVDEVRDVFTDYKLFNYSMQIIGGQDFEEKDERWSQAQKDIVWDEITALNRNPEFVPLLAARKTNSKLARLLFFGNSSTLSGRVRGHIRFAARCNTPFQGLAADGAKLAMFELLRLGFKVVGFVHDEVMIEVSKDEDIDQVYKDVDQIMCQTMDDLCPDIPIVCEGLVADCWGKVDQEYDEDGRIVPYVHTRKLFPVDYKRPEVDNQLRMW